MNLPTTVHVVNVMTHLPGIVLVCKYGQWDNVQLLVLVASIASSCLMHLSETKHQLPGMFGMGQFAALFLNLDRVFAIVLASMLMCYARTWQSPLNILLFLFALMASAAGELTNHHLTYLACHTFWHLVVFYLAGNIVTSHNATNPVVWVWSDAVAINYMTTFVISILAIGCLGFALLCLFPSTIIYVMEWVAPNALRQIQSWRPI